MAESTETNLEEELRSLSHEDLCEISISAVRRLTHSDSLLKDLPADVTLDEVNAQIAVAHGRSITVHVLRNQETTLDVVVRISLRLCLPIKSFQFDFL